MKNRKKDVKLLIIIVFTFTLGIVASGLTISYAATTLSSKNVYYDNSTSGGSSSNVSGAIDELYATADDQDILKAEIKSELIDIIYPVGSIFMTTDKDNYGTAEQVNQKIGGTWERYATDRTLVGYKDSGNEVNYTNGSKTVEILEENLPSHSHVIPSLSVSDWSGSHSHGGNGLYLMNLYGRGTTTSSGLVFSNTSNLWWNPNETRTMAETITVSGQTTNESNTTTCTNCSSKKINVQDPYIVVYMYKRTA